MPDYAHMFRDLAFLPLLLFPVSAFAQTPTPPPDDPLVFHMPTVTVTAQKEPQDRQKVPVSVTAVTKETLDVKKYADLSLVKEAAARLK